MADEDDYLSDKFLVEATSAETSAKTYSQRRRDVQKQGQDKMLANRVKSRRERELESREEGLSKSLFERAEEEQVTGLGSSNKALAMMLKMGFKPGEALGQKDAVTKASTPAAPSGSSSRDSTPEERQPRKGHRVEPLPVNEWTGMLFSEMYRVQLMVFWRISAGRKGIGLGKRTLSPTSAESLAKKSKLSEDIGKVDAFRDRTRNEHEERRAEGILSKVQLTCGNLDEKADIHVETFAVCVVRSYADYEYPLIVQCLVVK
jgi:hypothetical protein